MLKSLRMGALLLALCLGIAQNQIVSANEQNSEQETAKFEQETKRKKRNASIVRGVKLLVTGATVSCYCGYLDAVYCAKQKESFKHIYGSTMLKTISTIFGGMAGFGVKTLYDELVGYYL